MNKVLLTGSEGFIGGYVVKELLDQGYFVYGIDNLSKYGSIIRNHSDNKNFEFVEGDVKDKSLKKNNDRVRFPNCRCCNDWGNLLFS